MIMMTVLLLFAKKKTDINESHDTANIPPEINETKKIIALHVMTREEKVFAGYELLQALLSSGLRFGEMNIFHYYGDAGELESRQSIQNILFSLASATEPGVFDMVNMGAFSCKGLTLFMQKSEDADDNKKRYDLMLKTARHLSEDLDGLLLNDQRQPIPESDFSKQADKQEPAVEFRVNE